MCASICGRDSHSLMHDHRSKRRRRDRNKKQTGQMSSHTAWHGVTTVQSTESASAPRRTSERRGWRAGWLDGRQEDQKVRGVSETGERARSGRATGQESDGGSPSLWGWMRRGWGGAWTKRREGCCSLFPFLSPPSYVDLPAPTSCQPLPLRREPEWRSGAYSAQTWSSWQQMPQRLGKRDSHQLSVAVIDGHRRREEQLPFGGGESLCDP